MTSDRPYLSATRLDLFCRCPERYRRRYIEGDPEPASLPMLKGTALHRAAAVNFRQKIESGRDLPRDHIRELADAALTEEAEEREIAADPGKPAPLAIGQTRDALIELADVYTWDVAPDYGPPRPKAPPGKRRETDTTPTHVEQEVRISLPGPRDLLAVIDLCTADGAVVDLKTSKARKHQAEADHSVQLSVYAAAHVQLKGDLPSRMALDVITQTTTRTARQLLTTTREPADLTKLAHRIDAVNAAIDAGTFPPAPPGAWWCSPDYCGYWRSCRYVNAGRT